MRRMLGWMLGCWDSQAPHKNFVNCLGDAMKLNNEQTEYADISALRIDLYDCDNNRPARDYIAPIEPASAIARSWVPQTMGDQIWVMWKFESQKEREIFEAGLPDDVSRWLDREVIQHALPYGWKTRDANGWPC